ncbi:hypothetical protein RhiirA4_546864 [Rhizophagus irregularis]|uniref:Crinkler family protein n=1 Tax=Rhizophagus irregularis TaxID=588596 RepID=A0A2I1GZG6_9GLOM|nr:hypothetical protein RhiirA4_546864 [Rhizophagus irregularis]
MLLSLNCLVLGRTSNDIITKYIGENSKIGSVLVNFDQLTVAGFKKLLLREELQELATMDIWKVELDLESLKDKIYTENEIRNIGTRMESIYELKEYFNDYDKKPKPKYLHIFIVPTDVKKLSNSFISSKIFETREEVLRKAESHWTKLKEKLVKKIELEEFRVSDHIFKDSINASGIPVIKRKPSFLLHSLPNSDNKKGYIPEKMLSVLLKKVMTQRWLFLMGTSGSGKTRSLYELFCSTYGIYFSLNTEYDTSSMSRDVNENVNKWQRDAKDFIISTFKESCFSKLRKDKEVWNKVMDIVTLSMFPSSRIVKGCYLMAELNLPSGVSLYEKNFKIVPEKLVKGHNGQGNLDLAKECRSTGRIVGLVEVKRDDFKQGFAQSTVQMESSLTCRKRKANEIDDEYDMDKVWVL